MNNNTRLATIGSSSKAVSDRIVKVYESAGRVQRSDGHNWYNHANDVAYGLTEINPNLTIEHAATVIAHLSPRIRWSHNIIAAQRVARGDVHVRAVLPANVIVARASMLSDNPLSTLNGPKVKAFAANILGDTTENITIDAWAMRVALGRRDDLELIIKRVGMYEAISNGYKLAAKRIGIDPVDLQAITWLRIRDNKSF